MMCGYFITGTDTDCGKTFCSLAIMKAFIAAGYTTCGLKPLSCGCVQTKNGLRNDDALQLQAGANIRLPYNTVNPIAFEPAIAPHLAAEQENVNIEISDCLDTYKTLPNEIDIAIVEGVGGWNVPLGKKISTIDLANAYKLPVILVVGIRLGCLNHALLTYSAIKRSKLKLAGWVANELHPETEYSSENIGALKERINAPLLGTIPYVDGHKTKSTPELDISPLLK